VVYYHTSVAASGNVAAAREIQINRFSPTVNVNLNLNLSGQGDLVILAPSIAGDTRGGTQGMRRWRWKWG
jgi:hypothetical protein